jgi:hypothetical protein
MASLSIRPSSFNGDLVGYHDEHRFLQSGEPLPGHPTEQPAEPWAVEPVPRAVFLARCAAREQDRQRQRILRQQAVADVTEALTAAGFGPSLSDGVFEIDVRGHRMTLMFDQAPPWLIGGL